jgi:hypothetical protein
MLGRERPQFGIGLFLLAGDDPKVECLRPSPATPCMKCEDLTIENI